MRADQLYYTSCRAGLTSGGGYKSRAASGGLEADLRRQVERLSGYRPPDTLPPEPNAVEIATCPILFRFARLDGGRWALTRARYVGLDYSGRWGNFFAHTLVGTTGPIDRYPIDYYEWEGWRDSLAPGEGDRQPEPLAPVELDAIPDASSFTAAELAIFLSERPGRRERLASLIRGVLTYAPGKGRPIIVRDSEQRLLDRLRSEGAAAVARAGSDVLHLFARKSSGCGPQWHRRRDGAEHDGERPARTLLRL